MNLLPFLNRSGETKRRKGEIGDHAVGYCKPPVESRFRKGQSGNPRGRPRKSAAVVEVMPPQMHQSFEDMVLAEAYRPVRVRDGKREVEMSALQAGFRELGLAAGRGNRLAFATMAQLVLKIEANRPPPAPPEETLPPKLATAVEYKRVWTQVLADAEESRAILPAPVPHPDQIAIDREMGVVGFTGGAPEQPLSLDGLARMYVELKEDMRLDDEARANPDKDLPRPATYRNWFRHDAVVAAIEPHLPDRYRNWLPQPRLVAAPAPIRESLTIEVAEPALDGDPAESGELQAPEVAPDPPPDTRAVEEADVYRRIWERALCAISGSFVPIAVPAPHPAAVIVDRGANSVRYAAPGDPAQGATLAGVHAWLGVLRSDEDRLTAQLGENPGEPERSRLRRRLELVRELCAMIEWELAKAGLSDPATAELGTG